MSANTKDDYKPTKPKNKAKLETKLGKTNLASDQLFCIGLPANAQIEKNSIYT